MMNSLGSGTHPIRGGCSPSGCQELLVHESWREVLIVGENLLVAAAEWLVRERCQGGGGRSQNCCLYLRVQYHCLLSRLSVIHHLS